MFDINFTRMKIDILIQESALLPKDKAAAFRVGITQFLIKQNCVMPKHYKETDMDCTGCLFYESCVARNILYATYKKKPDIVAPSDSVGYMIECVNVKQEFKKNDTLALFITLFGGCVSYFSPILHALYSLGVSGIGDKQIKFSIDKITNREGKMILLDNVMNMKNILIENLDEYVKEKTKNIYFDGILRTVTPCILKFQGEFLQEFNSRAIIYAITRQLYMLNCYVGNDMEQIYEDNDEFPKILEQEVAKAEINEALPEESAGRLSGIRGSIRFGAITPYMMKLLVAGEVIHMGNHTRIGYGDYEMI